MQSLQTNPDGTQTLVKLNGDGSLTTGTIQDCDAILDHTKALHNEGFHGSSEMKFAASIPHVVVEKYCNDNNILFSDFMHSQEHKKRLLNDPALAYFRVWKGRV